MQARYAPWFLIRESATRRMIFGLWAVAVAIYEIAIVMPIGAHLHPGLNGWASLLLTDGTLGPIFAICLFQVLVLVTALAFPALTNEKPVRVALTLSAMNCAALTTAAVISSGGASIVVIAAVAVSTAALYVVHNIAPQFVLASSIVLFVLVLSSIGIGSLLVGAGTAVTGALTVIFLLETRDGAASNARFDEHQLAR